MSQCPFRGIAREGVTTPSTVGALRARSPPSAEKQPYDHRELTPRGYRP